VAGAKFHLSVEADLRSGLRRAALLNLAAFAQRPFSTAAGNRPGGAMLEIPLQSEISPTTRLTNPKPSRSQAVNGSAPLPRPTARHRIDPCEKSRLNPYPKETERREFRKGSAVFLKLK